MELKAESISGRVLKPVATVRVSGGSLFVRLDSRQDLAFWAQVELTRETLLEALRHLGSTRARVVAQGDSGDAFGDTSRVVGYASVVWES